MPLGSTGRDTDRPSVRSALADLAKVVGGFLLVLLVALVIPVLWIAYGLSTMTVGVL